MSTTVRMLRARSRDLLFERRLGIQTDGVVPLDANLDAEELVGYMPSPWLAFRRLIPRRSVSPNDVFVDFGSGKGRVIAQAATYPFARVIGLELSEELNELARANLATHRKIRAGSVELVTVDATQWQVPDDVTVAYFFNPFVGETFRTVIDNLIASWDRKPRLLRIVYVNPLEHEWLAANERIRPDRRVRLGRRERYGALIKAGFTEQQARSRKTAWCYRVTTPGLSGSIPR